MTFGSNVEAFSPDLPDRGCVSRRREQQIAQRAGGRGGTSRGDKMGGRMILVLYN